jgi:hypothetical protein
MSKRRKSNNNKIAHNENKSPVTTAKCKQF